MLERVKGIEPSYEAWEAAVLPLNYTRESLDSIQCVIESEAVTLLAPSSQTVPWLFGKLAFDPVQQSLILFSAGDFGGVACQ